jgi:hypothetical protein
MVRRFEWADGEVRAEGEPTGAEQESRTATTESGTPWKPSEAVVMAVAGEVSVDPSQFGPRTPTSGEPILAITKQGRRQEVLKDSALRGYSSLCCGQLRGHTAPPPTTPC